MKAMMGLILAFSLFSSDTIACSCGGARLSDAERLKMYDSIFLARVMEKDGTKLKFIVSRNLKGRVPQIFIADLSSRNTCSISPDSFSKDQTYLIGVDHSSISKNTLRVELCDFFKNSNEVAVSKIFGADLIESADLPSVILTPCLDWHGKVAKVDGQWLESDVYKDTDRYPHSKIMQICQSKQRIELVCAKAGYGTSFLKVVSKFESGTWSKPQTTTISSQVKLKCSDQVK